MTRKRTFSLPDEVSDALDQVAGDNASAYVAEALRDRMAREAAAQRIRAAYGEIDQAAYDHWVQRLTGTSTQRAS
jgi:predicted transcriptional regulator